MSQYAKYSPFGGGGSGASSEYWKDAVASVGSLPGSDTTGAIRQTLDTGDLYRWDGASWNLYFDLSASVTGPASSTDNAIARFDGTGGNTVQNSSVTIDDSNNVSGVVNLTTTGSTTLDGLVATTVPYLDGSRVLTSSTVTPTELGYLSGVTSDIQTQLDSKLDDVVDDTTPQLGGNLDVNGNSIVSQAGVDVIIAPGTSGDLAFQDGSQGTVGHVWTSKTIAGDGNWQVLNHNDRGDLQGGTTNQYYHLTSAEYTGLSGLGNSFAVQSDGSGNLESSAVTSTELGYVSGVTSAIQTQLGAKLNLAGGTMTGALTLNADPSSSLHAATKQYVDGLIDGVKRKVPAKAATFANITLSGEQTIDDVSCVTGDVVLVAGQNDDEDNGTYTVDSGAWSRVQDMDSVPEVNSALVTVAQGTEYAETGWYQYQTVATLGTDAINFIQQFGAGTYVADEAGITLSGSTFSLELDGTTLSKSASGLKVNALGITNSEINTSAAIAATKLGNGDVDNTELSYLNGVTSAIQTQLNAKASLTGTETLTNKTITKTSNKIRRGISPIAGSTTLDESVHDVLLASGNITLTLPAAASNAGVYFTVKKADAIGTTVVIDGNASETVDGEITQSLTQQYESLTVVSDGAGWNII